MICAEWIKVPWIAVEKMGRALALSCISRVAIPVNLGSPLSADCTYKARVDSWLRMKCVCLVTVDLAYIVGGFHSCFVCVKQYEGRQVYSFNWSTPVFSALHAKNDMCFKGIMIQRSFLWFLIFSFCGRLINAYITPGYCPICFVLYCKWSKFTLCNINRWF